MRWLLTLLCLCLLSLNAAAQVDWDFLAMAASQQAQINGAGGGGGGGGTDINASLSWFVPMDEGTGNTATNAVAGRSSITSLSLHYWTNGVSGKGLGWTTADTRTPNGGDTGIGGLSKASFSVWFKREAAGDKPYIAYDSADASLLLGVAISWQQDDLVRIAFTNSQNVAFTLLSSTLGTWQNIIWTYDGTQGTATNRVRGYLNGTPQNMTFTGTVPTNIHSAGTNSYPCRNPFGGNFYIGQIDAPRVYTNLVIGTDVISSLQTNQ